MEHLVSEIKKSKKYKGLSRDLIRKHVVKLKERYPKANDKGLLKEIKGELHKLYGAFQTTKVSKREKAFENFIYVYQLEVLGQKRIDILAEHYQSQLLIKISPQAGSETGGVLLREEFARNPEIFYTGTVGGKVNFCSERYIYLVEVRAR